MPLKIFIYAQDTLGLGHVKRCVTLARSVLDLRPDAAVLLATKSAWPGSFDLGPRFDFLKLPAQLSLAASSPGERDAERDAIRALRRDLLREAVRHFRPQLVLVDNEPLGFGGEMVPALDSAGRAKLVFGMRDVVDDPERTRQAWTATKALDALSERFDRILVYGHRELFDTLEFYGLQDSLADKARYTGYVCGPRNGLDSGRLRSQLDVREEPLVLATAGGGRDSIPLFSAAIGALPLLRFTPKPRLLLVTGPFIDSSDSDKLTQLAKSHRFLIRRSLDIVEAMTAAQALATMGGYNTLAEAMMLGRCPVVVPRATRKREQLIRAQAFASRGLAHCLPPEQATPEAMAEALDSELSRPVGVDGARYLDPNGRRAAKLLLEALDA